MSLDSSIRQLKNRVKIIKGLVAGAVAILVLSNLGVFFENKEDNVTTSTNPPQQEIASADISNQIETPQDIAIFSQVVDNTLFYQQKLDTLEQQLSDLNKERAEEQAAYRDQIGLLQKALNETRISSDDNTSYQRLYFAKVNEIENILEEGQNTRKTLTNQVAQLGKQLNELQKSNTALMEELDLVKKQTTTYTKSNNNEWKQKYEDEAKLRQEKEELLAQFNDTLDEQKAALLKIEDARQKLVLELETIKKAPLPAKSSTPSLVTAPAPQKAESANRKTHKVAKGETLSSISLKYYGTSNRWNEIYEANKGVIPDKNSIRLGTEIVIP